MAGGAATHSPLHPNAKKKKEAKKRWSAKCVTNILRRRSTSGLWGLKAGPRNRGRRLCPTSPRRLSPATRGAINSGCRADGPPLPDGNARTSSIPTSKTPAGRYSPPPRRPVAGAPARSFHTRDRQWHQRSQAPVPLAWGQGPAPTGERGRCPLAERDPSTRPLPPLLPLPPPPPQQNGRSCPCSTPPPACPRHRRSSDRLHELS